MRPMNLDLLSRKAILGPAAALVLVAGAVAGCSSNHGASSGGANDSAAGKAMLAAWKSGTCPSDGSDWGGFTSGMALPTAKAGQTVALLPGTVTRIVLCRFDLDTSVLTGSALVTDTSTVTRLRTDLNSVTAVANSSCIQGDQVIIMAGDGDNVVGFNALVGPCPYLNSPSQVADFGNTSLAHDLDTVLGPVATPTS